MIQYLKKTPVFQALQGNHSFAIFILIAAAILCTALLNSHKSIQACILIAILTTITILIHNA